MPKDGMLLTLTVLYRCTAEKALATLQARPIPNLQPPVVLVLSPYPSTTPPTPLPPPSASPRLVKHLPPGYTDSQLYDLFRPYGALASVRTQAGFGKDTGVVEFWREEDARDAEEAMHCADVEGQNIAVQVYQPRRAGATMSEFNAAAPTFVPTGAIMPQYPTQVRVLCHHSVAYNKIFCSTHRLTVLRINLREALFRLFMDLDNKFNTLR
jgi:polyadenylate-binding protein